MSLLLQPGPPRCEKRDGREVALSHVTGTQVCSSSGIRGASTPYSGQDQHGLGSFYDPQVGNDVLVYYGGEVMMR